MKKLVVVLISAALAFSAALLLAASGVFYPQALIVRTVEEDTVFLNTVSGYHSYELQGAEDFLPGDVVSALMYSRLTKNVSDDIVIPGSVRCS